MRPPARRLGLTSRLALTLLVAPALAGCQGGTFSVDVSLWMAGYAWEYDETVRDVIEIEGEPPMSLGAEEEGELRENRTRRMEVFNSTAGSVEGIPIYAAAILSRTLPDNDSEEEGEEPTETWDAAVFTADLNHVEPTYVDWRNQEVQLSGEEGGVAEEGTAGNDTNNQPENEQRLLDWPLSKNKRWRHAEHVGEIEAEGVFDGRVLGKGTQRVLGASYDVVRLSGTLEPLDTNAIAEGIAESMESQGAEVEAIRFDYEITYDYSYGERVLNFVQFKETKRIVLSAEGKDDEGGDFDFTFTQTRVTERHLRTFQLEAGVERPLTFALDVERGEYAPKPITPASHLAVEILATSQSLNAASEDKVSFGVRIFNSTAGEKRLRAPDAAYPQVVPPNQFRAEYDHSYLEIVWQLESVDRRNNLHEFKTAVTDALTLKASDFPTQGWKQIRATLQLKNAENTTDPTIFTDFVAFEVYLHMNRTVTRLATNVTPGSEIRASFPVEPSATRVTVKGAVQSTPPEAMCPIAGTQDCIQIRDSGNRPVADDRSTRMEFETTRVGSYNFGYWAALYSPSSPGQSVTFEVVVRYRVGA